MLNVLEHRQIVPLIAKHLAQVIKDTYIVHLSGSVVVSSSKINIRHRRRRPSVKFISATRLSTLYEQNTHPVRSLFSRGNEIGEMFVGNNRSSRSVSGGRHDNRQIFLSLKSVKSRFF